MTGTAAATVSYWKSAPSTAPTTVFLVEDTTTAATDRTWTSWHASCRVTNGTTTANSWAWPCTEFYTNSVTHCTPIVQYLPGNARYVRLEIPGVPYWKLPGVVPPADRLREIIQARAAPAIITSRKSLAPVEDIKEIRARETLKRILGEDKFRTFLRNGFVSVRAKSGLVYQIFPDHGITKVYQDGTLVERLCVVFLNSKFPPTDSLIMRYLLILNDEQEFRKYAIKHSVTTIRKPSLKPDERSLTEIYREVFGKVA